MTLTAPALRWGSHAIGVAPWGGYSPTEILPVVNVEGLPAIAANDRYQIIVCSEEGSAAVLPQIRYWLGQAPEWGSVLGSGDRDSLVHYFANDENGDPVLGVLETPFAEVPKGQTATVAYVLVEYVPRPYVLGDFDGGLAPTDPIGFTVYVEASGIVDYAEAVSPTPRVSGVRVEAGDPEVMDAETISSAVWPDIFTAVVPIRIEEPAKQVRVAIRDIRHCQIEAIEVYGYVSPARQG